MLDCCTVVSQMYFQFLVSVCVVCPCAHKRTFCGQRRMSAFFFYPCSLPYSFETGSVTERKLTVSARLDGQELPSAWLSFLYPIAGFQAHTLMLYFSHGYRGLNLSLHTCTPSTLTHSAILPVLKIYLRCQLIS